MNAWATRPWSSARLVVLAAVLTACQPTAEATANGSRPAADPSTPTASAEPSPRSSLSAQAATAEPSSSAPPPSTLRVAASSLTVWAEPDSGGEQLGVLPAGTVLYVLIAGEEASAGWRRVGLDWRRADCGEHPCLPVTVGWIEPSAEVTDASITCPPMALEADELRQTPPLVALGCFGKQQLVVTGVVPETVSPFGWSDYYVIEPAWLSSLSGPYIGHTGLTLHVDPASGVELPELTAGAFVRATGSLDSQVAASCVAKTLPTGPGQVEIAAQREAAQLYCRAQFVVSDVVVAP